MNYKYTIPAALIGVSIALVQPQVAFALSSGEVAKMAKQITVLIAHRLSTIMHADKIIVLEHGKIIEQGKHEKLLEEKGLYYAMWRQQVGENKPAIV